MKFIQGVCAMLALAIALLLGGAIMVNSANAQPRAAVAPAPEDRCVAGASGCSTGQGVFLTILEPGQTPTPEPTPTPTPSVEPTDQPGPGEPPTANGPNGLPRTGPRETAITAAIGLLVLQLGLVMTVRARRGGQANGTAARHA